MSFLNAMQERYTTKKYNNVKKINSEKIAELKEILRLSPSSINSQPWRFTFVSDIDTKKKFAEASFFNASKIEQCDTLVVFSRIDNINAFEKQINNHLPEGAVGYYNNFLKDKPASEIKSWFSDQTYLALGVFLSACATMKIDATPMEGIEPEKYNLLLNDKNYTALVGVCIGYRDNNDGNMPSKNPKSRLLLNDVIKSM